jgi:hypothetical protein
MLGFQIYFLRLCKVIANGSYYGYYVIKNDSYPM